MRKNKTNGGEHAWKDASVEFFCADEEHGVLVSVPGLKFLPRVGESVVLPGPDKDSKSAIYDVVAVNHNFYSEMAGELGPNEARLISINVTVKRAGG
jgi:hypothetical protein